MFFRIPAAISTWAKGRIWLSLAAAYVVCNALTDRCRIRSRVYYAGVSVNVNYIILRNQHESAHSNVTSRVC